MHRPSAAVVLLLGVLLAGALVLLNTSLMPPSRRGAPLNPYLLSVTLAPLAGGLVGVLLVTLGALLEAPTAVVTMSSAVAAGVTSVWAATVVFALAGLPHAPQLLVAIGGEWLLLATIPTLFWRGSPSGQLLRSAAQLAAVGVVSGILIGGAYWHWLS